MSAELADQLIAECSERLRPFAALACGELAEALDDLPEVIARRLVGPLTSPDRHEAAQAVIDVMCALWAVGEPPAIWWATPLGRVCARLLAASDREVVTHAEAAEMLGVARGTVSTLVSRGRLARHPDGGVCRSSVLARLGGR